MEARRLFAPELDHNDPLDGYGERLHRGAHIVFKRLADFDASSHVPVQSSGNVQVFSLGPLKSQPLAGPRLVAIATIPVRQTYVCSDLLDLVHRAFLADRGLWDATRNDNSGVLRSVRLSPTTRDGTQFQCDVVRAAINSICGGLVSPREFLCLEGTWKNVARETLFSCGFSLDDRLDTDARIPSPLGFIRGVAHPSGYLFERSGPSTFTFRYTVHAQPGGSIPIGVVNETAPVELFRVVRNFVAYLERVLQ